MVMARARARLAGAAAAALSVSALWVSGASLAVVEANSSTRIVALPPPWLLALLVAAVFVVAWVRRWPARLAAPWLPAVVLWLPYVPGPIPAAFLLWQGPAEAVVWVLVAVGCWIQWRLTKPPTGLAVLHSPRVAPWIAAALTIVAVLAASLWLAPRLPGGDEPHYLVIAESLWRDHDVAVGNNHDRIDYAPFTANKLDPHYVRRGLDGQIYSVHAPGLALIVLPAFVVTGVAGAGVVVMLMTALAAALTWSAAWRLTASSSAAWIGWASVFLTAPVFLQAFLVMPDGPATLGVAAGLWLLVRLAAGAQPRDAAVIAVSGLLAMLPWLHSRFALLALPLGLAVVARLWQLHARRTIGAFLAVPLIAAAAWFAFFWVIWGTPNPNAPWGDFARPALDKVLPGLTGLFFDQHVGLFVQAPIYVAAVAGAVGLLRGRPRLGLECALAAVPYVLIVSAYDGWPGGFGGPARYLVAVLPLAAVAIAWLWSSSGAAARSLTGVALTTSGCLLVGRLVAWDGARAFVDSYGREVLLGWWSPAVTAMSALPNTAEPGAARVAAIWAMCVVMATAIVVIRRRASDPAVTWARASVCAALTPMLAMSTVWSTRGEPGVAPGPAQLAFIGDWRPGWRTTLVQWRPPFVVSAQALLRRVSVPMVPIQTRGGAQHAYTATDVPAGRYTLALTADRLEAGELVVRAGDSGVPLALWPIDPRVRGSVTLQLPVGVASLAVTGEPGVMATIHGITLNVTALPPTPSADRAVHGVHIGGWRAFFLDSRAYVEQGGFWTTGASDTRVLLERDADGEGDEVQLQLQSGPVAVDVDIRSPNSRAHVSLAAHERRVVPVKTDADHRARLAIATSAAFLPVQHDRTNGDFRHLGVWVVPR